ncbi:hypothetical protein EI555_005978, partial [Monodon monoceros]
LPAQEAPVPPSAHKAAWNQRYGQMEPRVHGFDPPGLEEGTGTETPKGHGSKQDHQESTQGQLRHQAHQALSAQADLRFSRRKSTSAHKIFKSPFCAGSQL